MDYEFSGAANFVNASVTGTQLDPSTCHPLALGALPAATGTVACAAGATPCPTITNAGFTIVRPDVLSNPVTPGGVLGTTLNPATATGP